MASNMLIESISLTRDTAPQGFLVVSALVYQGDNGSIGDIPSFPPIHYRRRPAGSGNQQAFRHAFGGDGALICSFSEAPSAVGWVITVSRAEDQQKAGKLLEILGKGLAAIGEIVAPLEIPGKALEAVGAAISAVPGARLLGTHVGSEVDRADLERGFRLELSDFKTKVVLKYA